jgi:capsid protein
VWELDQYDDAELLRKRFAAVMIHFITRQNPVDAFFPNAAPREATGAGGVAGPSLPSPTARRGSVRYRLA